MTSSEPFEIIIGPADVYYAPVGTPFPHIDAVPSGAWKLIGKAGSKNYAESGVILRTNRTVNYVRTLGSIAPRKTVISEMGFEVEFNLIDLSPEALALSYGVNPDAIDNDAGNDSFALSTSPIPLELAILIRVEQSPNGGDNAQWEIYQATQTGSGQGTFSKTEGFGTQNIWSAVEDSDGNFVTYRVANEGS